MLPLRHLLARALEPVLQLQPLRLALLPTLVFRVLVLLSELLLLLC
jgi:hypothetical protein